MGRQTDSIKTNDTGVMILNGGLRMASMEEAHAKK